MLFGKHVNKYYFRYFYLLLGGILTLFIVDVTQLQIPVIVGDIINGLNKYINPAIEVEKLTLEMLVGSMKTLAIIGVIMFFGRFLWRVTIFNMGIRIEADLRNEMFEHSARMSKNYYNTHKTGEEMALYTNDVMVIRQTFASGTLMVCDALFLGIYAFIKMVRLNLTLTLLSSIPLVFMAAASFIVGKSLKKKSLARQEAFSNLTAFTTEDITGITVIKAFVKEANELLRFNKVNKDNKDKNLSHIKYAMLLQVMMGMFINSILIVGLIYVSYLRSSNSAAFYVGDLMKFISYFDSLIWPMMAIVSIINIHAQGKASLKRISTMLDTPAEIHVENPVDVNIQGNINYNNLSFKYPGSELYALQDINLNIKAGEKVGIIGRTGCGKTTLVDLLLHTYNIDRDKITIDNVDLMDIGLDNLRNSIGYVPQDNFLFSSTVLENICFGVDVDLEKAKEYAEYASVAKDIEDFPDKYDTIVGERGVTLSGGQRQRISIARAMIKDPQILILDDSVSAVDTETEEKILNYIHRVRSNKTTIIIAHRISTVKDLDKIVLLENGRILDVGTHEELLQNSKTYQEMVLLQQLDDEEGGM